MAGDGRVIAEAIAAARPLADRFHEAGHTLFLVGGVVRDQALDGDDILDSDDIRSDLDCTTDARPDQIRELVVGIADRIWTHGEQFGTIGCRIGPQIFEITTHRADAYEPDSRKPVVAFGDTIEADLARRDFTVNAMAIDLADGRLVDPFGGRSDLDVGVLRTPLEPEISFAEDPLRMLRAARFIAAFDLRPTPDLSAAVTAMVARIDIVSIERIRDELDVLLRLDQPGRGLDFLVTTGLWSRLFPELDPATAARLGRRVSEVDPAPGERWAALVSMGAGGLLDRLRLSNAVRADVRWLLGIMTRVTQDPPTKDRGLRALAETVPDDERLERAVEFIASLVAADGGDEGPISELRGRVADLRSREPDFDHPRLPLGGDDVMELLGLVPGPEVGRAIERLRRHRIEHGPLTAEEATRLLTGS